LHDAKLHLAIREELRLEVEHLHDSHSFHGVEWYLPYCYDQPASLIDYVGAEATLVVDDTLDLFATLQELEQQAEQLRVELERSGELPRVVRNQTRGGLLASRRDRLHPRHTQSGAAKRANQTARDERLAGAGIRRGYEDPLHRAQTDPGAERRCTCITARPSAVRSGPPAGAQAWP